MAIESLRVNGIEVALDDEGNVFHLGQNLGRVQREERFGQWYWRAYNAETGDPYKRFLTSRPEAIALLLINADLVGGIGF